MGLVLLVLAASSAQASLIFDVNVIQNPGADAGLGSIRNNTIVNVPDWTLTQGSFTAVQYSNTPLGVPQVTDPGPPDRGVNLFAGGPNPDPDLTDFISQGDQILDVGDQAGLIDLNMVAFTLSGWLGGYFDQRDTAILSAIFLDVNGNVISIAMIGPVDLSERTDMGGIPQTELLFRDTAGNIPIGTRTIDFQLLMHGIDGDQNDGYADSLSFVATTAASAEVPEPGSMALFGLGLTSLWLLRRKARG